MRAFGFIIAGLSVFFGSVAWPFGFGFPFNINFFDYFLL